MHRKGKEETFTEIMGRGPETSAWGTDCFMRVYRSNLHPVKRSSFLDRPLRPSFHGLTGQLRQTSPSPRAVLLAI